MQLESSNSQLHVVGPASGVRDLIPQRQFIENFFPTETWIREERSLTGWLEMVVRAYRLARCVVPDNQLDHRRDAWL